MGKLRDGTQGSDGKMLSLHYQARIIRSHAMELKLNYQKHRESCRQKDEAGTRKIYAS